MKKYENGKYVELTTEEIAALQQEASGEETVEERLASLEALLAERGRA